MKCDTECGDPFEMNLKKLPLVGKGGHGSIYRLDDTRCIKECKEEAFMKMEYRVLEHSKHFSHFPRVYACRGKRMIREYFEGPNAETHIKKNGLSKEFAKKLLELIEIFRQLGYTRIDCQLRHVIVVRGERLKFVDPTRYMDKVSKHPLILMRELKKLRCKKTFLEYVKELRPDLFEKWKKIRTQP